MKSPILLGDPITRHERKMEKDWRYETMPQSILNMWSH